MRAENAGRGSGLLRPICIKLRHAFVALLTVALLVGPCLTLASAFGVNPAHAHGNMNHMLPHDTGSGHAHGHHSASHDAYKAHGGAHGTSHHPSPLTCEELCEGWALKKSQRIWATASSDSDDAPPLLRLRLVKIEFSPPLQLAGLQPELVQRTTLPASSLVYELTGRYRL